MEKKERRQKVAERLSDENTLQFYQKILEGSREAIIVSQSRLCGNFFGSLKIDVSHRLANHFFEFHP